MVAAKDKSVPDGFTVRCETAAAAYYVATAATAKGIFRYSLINGWETRKAGSAIGRPLLVVGMIGMIHPNGG